MHCRTLVSRTPDFTLTVKQLPDCIFLVVDFFNHVVGNILVVGLQIQVDSMAVWVVEFLSSVVDALCHHFWLN